MAVSTLPIRGRGGSVSAALAMVIELHHSGTLFGQQSQVQGLQFGAAQIISPTALQQGVIDAGEVTPNSWRGSSSYQFIKDIILTNPQYSFYLVGANKMWWDDMPVDVKAEVEAAFAAATEWNMVENDRINADDISYMAGEGVKIHELTPEQRANWAEAMQPVWQELGNDLVGDEVTARLKEIGGVATGN